MALEFCGVETPVETDQKPAAQEHTASNRQGLAVWLARLALITLPLIPYGGSLGFGLLGLDDQLYYLNNPALRGGALDGLSAIWSSVFLSDYAPISNLTLWLDLALFGEQNWRGARLHGLLWFGLGTLAVHELVYLITRRWGVAFTVAVLYALHPVCAPSVLWLAERKHLVSFALALWSVYFYVRAREGEWQWKPYALSMLLAVLALLAKPHAVALPVMLFMYEAFLGKGRWIWRVLPVSPFAALSMAFVFVSMSLLREDLDRAFLGGSRLAAIASDGPVLLRYLWHTICPFGLTLYYFVEELSFAAPRALGAWAAVLAVVGVTVWLARERRLVLFGWFFGVAAISPALNLVPQLAPMADHYLQWALPGLLLVIVSLTACALDRLDARDAGARRFRWHVPLIGGAALFLLVPAMLRTHEFSSRRALFETAVVWQPNAALNWAGYAEALTGSPDKADAELIGMAGLNALRCPDAHRLMPQQRALAIREAALFLFRNGDKEEAWTLTEAECAKFKPGEELFQKLTRAEVAARTGRASLAIELLEPSITPEMRTAMEKLRIETRQTPKFPNDLAPVLSLQGTGSDTFAQGWGDLLGVKTLQVLGYAYLASNENEKAFDIGALMVNSWPDDPRGRAILAAALHRFGDHERATKIQP